MLGRLSITPDQLARYFLVTAHETDVQRSSNT
jgi:hypothetical protein